MATIVDNFFIKDLKYPRLDEIFRKLRHEFWYIYLH